MKMRSLYAGLITFLLLNSISAEEEKADHSVIEYIQELTGKTDALTQLVETLEKRIEILEAASQVRCAKEKGKTPEKTSAVTSVVSANPKRPFPPAGVNQLWNDSQRALQNKKFSAAEQLFFDFVRTYPEHENAPEANYWLGEINLINKKYVEAQSCYALAYKAFLENNPRKADVGLKIAECYFALNKNKKGCLFLKEIMKLKHRGANISNATLQLMQKYWVQHKCADL
jgi:TolA-binding protein